MSNEIKVSGNAETLADQRRLREQFTQLQAWRDEPLHPDLVPWLDEVTSNSIPMLRHPLVYDMLPINGMANRAYARKKELLAEAREMEDWQTVVFLHERPYRLRALIEYVTGCYDDGDPDDPDSVIPLDVLMHSTLIDWTDVLDLVADVWVDSENISQMIEQWRVLFGDAQKFFLGTYTEQQEFAALPDPITAYRAGIDDGDWSWSTKKGIAAFFAKRLRDDSLPVIEAQIPKADCFGYLTRRGEAELLVRVSGNQSWR